MMTNRRHATAGVVVLGAVAWLGLGEPPGIATPEPRVPAAGLDEAVHRAAAQDTPVVTPHEYDGWRYMMVHCARCHGEGARGSVFAPGLLAPVERAGFTRDSFIKVVLEGSVQRGMPAFDQLMGEEQAGAIHDYVEARTKGLPAGRPKVEEPEDEPSAAVGASGPALVR